MNTPHGSQRHAARPVRRDAFDESEPASRSTGFAGDDPHSGIAPIAAPAIEPRRGSAFEIRAFPVFLALVLVAVALGWLFRDRLKIESESGLGYWLGVAGLSCVGILLIYPLRKRVPKLAFIGSVPGWFHFHMALGLLAPALILFHAGFRYGSVNAAVALVSMLIVAGSGLLGRMLYVRVHRNLTGKRVEVTAMARDAGRLRQTLIHEFAEIADITDRLEATLHRPRPNVFSAMAYAFATSTRISIARRQMLHALKRGSKRMRFGHRGGAAAARRLRRDGAMLVEAYCRELRHAAYLGFLERLFALWHIIHMPLFVLMLVAAVIHVVAVHQY